jgi:hypothetical protein
MMEFGAKDAVAWEKFLETISNGKEFPQFTQTQCSSFDDILEGIAVKMLKRMFDLQNQNGALLAEIQKLKNENEYRRTQSKIQAAELLNALNH